MSVYIVIENGVPYPMAFKTFDEAKESVKRKYSDYYVEEIHDYLRCGIYRNFGFNVKEDETGNTTVYVGNEIQVHIHKLPL